MRSLCSFFSSVVIVLGWKAPSSFFVFVGRFVIGTTLPFSIIFIIPDGDKISLADDTCSKQDKGSEADGASPLFDFGLGMIRIPKRAVALLSMLPK